MITQLPDLSALPWPEGCTHFDIRSEPLLELLQNLEHEDMHYLCLCAAEWFRVQAEAWSERYIMDCTQKYTFYAFRQYIGYSDQWRAAALQIERAMTETSK